MESRAEETLQTVTYVIASCERLRLTFRTIPFEAVD
jgi:hypothetical protein